MNEPESIALAELTVMWAVFREAWKSKAPTRELVRAAQEIELAIDRLLTLAEHSQTEQLKHAREMAELATRAK